MKKVRLLLVLCLVAVMTIGMALAVSADDIRYTTILIPSIPAVEAGAPVEPYSYTPPEGAWNEGAYTVSGAWHVYDDATQTTSPATGNFEEGKLYQLKLSVTMGTEWAYHDSDLYVESTGNWYASVGEGLNYAIVVPMSSAAEVREFYTEGMPESITAGAAITAPTVALSQEALEYDIMSDCVNLSARWLDADGNPASGTFQDGKVYYLEVTATPKAGYYLGQWVFIRDWNTNQYADAVSDGITVKALFRYSLLPRVTEVAITGVTGAQIGNAPTTAGITAPTGAKYQVADCRWYNSDNGEEVAVFEDGKKYILHMGVRPAAGYDFDEELTLTVNGEPVDADDYYINNEELYIRLPYSFLDAITAVDITVPTPELGQTISLDGIVLPEGVTLDTMGSYWYDETAGEQATGTFQKGHRYNLNLSFNPTSGYEFAEDAVLTINGQNVDGHETFYGHLNSDYGYLSGAFSFLDQVSEVKITGVIAPVAGQTATLEGIQITGGVLDTESTGWYQEGGEPFTGTFENGKAYYLDIYFKPAQGSEFTNSCVVTINGEEAQYGYAQGEYGNVWNRYSLKTVISKVEITGLPQFSVGGTASVEGLKAPQDVNYTVGAMWAVVDGEGDFTGTFETGKIYGLLIEAEPKDGYEFAEELELLIDGAAPQTQWQNYNEGYAQIIYYFMPGATMVDKVEITAPTPVVGADIKNADIKVPENAPYEFEAIWLVSTDGKSWAEATGKFEDGKYYALVIEVKTDMDESVFFANEVQLLLNGTAIDLSAAEANPSYINLMHELGKLCSHTYGNWTSDGANTHSHTCTKCGDKVTENHVWENDKDGKCDTCGYVRSDNPPTGDAIGAICLLALCSMAGLVITKRRFTR